MRSREFIVEIQWFQIMRYMYEDVQLLPYHKDFSGDCYISVPDITNEDLLYMKLRFPRFTYREV